MHANQHIYLNGEILPAEKAAISPFDIGLLRGYAVFDLLQTVDGAPFMLTEHLSRFRASAAHLDLEVPATDEAITSAITELLALNDHGEATVRMVLTGGVSPDGMHYDPSTPTFFMITHPMFAMPPEFYSEGATILTQEHRREIPEAKTTNYLTWLKNHPRIDEAGAVDVLYHFNGVISEAATASFYVVRDSRIFAPDKGVLWGTIGSLVLELAEGHFELVYTEITLDEVLTADEAFLTSSVRGIVPIVRIDTNVVGEGSPGPVTRTLMRMYQERIHGSDGRP
jgi:branched-subunit amino acid aminotransferase/4-amino-4-deoxychorismate lyase